MNHQWSLATLLLSSLVHELNRSVQIRYNRSFVIETSNRFRWSTFLIVTFLFICLNNKRNGRFVASVRKASGSPSTVARWNVEFLVTIGVKIISGSSISSLPWKFHVVHTIAEHFLNQFMHERDSISENPNTPKVWLSAISAISRSAWFHLLKPNAVEHRHGPIRELVGKFITMNIVKCLIRLNSSYDSVASKRFVGM